MSFQVVLDLPEWLPTVCGDLDFFESRSIFCGLQVSVESRSGPVAFVFLGTSIALKHRSVCDCVLPLTFCHFFVMSLFETAKFLPTEDPLAFLFWNPFTSPICFVLLDFQLRSCSRC